MLLTKLNSISQNHFITSIHQSISVVERERLLYIKIVIYRSFSIHGSKVLQKAKREQKQTIKIIELYPLFIEENKCP